MNCRTVLFAATLCATITLPCAAADPGLPNAGTIMDRYVEVTGGAAAYDKLHNEVTIIDMEFVGRGIKGTLTRYSDSSNNSYSTGQLEGVGKLEEGVYNGQAWENSAMMGPRVKQGAENADAVRDGFFNASRYWRKLYKAETTGIETVNGEDCYAVVLTPLTGGKPETMYMSKKTGYMVKLKRTVVSAMGEIPLEATASDYKRFGEIIYPGRLVQTFAGNEIAFTTVSVKTNQELPPDRFEPPAEIEKLIAK